MYSQSASSPADAQTEAQIVYASSLFMASAAVLFTMFAFSFYMTASIQVFCTIGLPLYYLYFVQTRPANSSFDAKYQLKRVLAGSDLPDGDPNKPRGILHKMGRNITSTLATTAATAGGYAENFYNILWAVTVVKVSMPTANMDVYWIGCVGTWFYWCAVDTSNKSD